MAVNLAGFSRTPLAQDALGLRRVFETIHSESCPTIYNFHMHTACSDGRLQPEEILHQAIAIGLQGLAITDHHTIDGYFRAQRWLGERRTRSQNETLASLRLWTGIEVTSKLFDIEVHILGYAFNPDSACLRPYLQRHAPHGSEAAAENVIQAIHAAGGLAVLAHPARYRRSPEEVIAATVNMGIDGVETYYAYNNPNPWRPSPQQTEMVQRLSSTHGLLNTCGTDTHGASLLQRL